jgi:2-polyprenyl-3-methyl-5-hydroxy-6-metoxy-1,4-benzoquinol methylase
LEVARDFGYAVEGLELSKWSSEIVKRKGIKVRKELLKSLSSRFPRKFDVITMWGVIEHFQNPRSEMIYINKLLKPGGILVVWTGDVNGIMSRILGRRWWYWQGQHIQYFTSSSLNYLGQLTGFEHIATKLYPIAATYDQIINSLNRYKFKKYLIPIIKFMFSVKKIWYLRMPGEMLWFGRKTSDK